jgi:hypothetical protein
VKSDTFSTTSQNGTWADVTGLSVTITPTTTSKKVRIEVGLHLGSNQGAASVGFRLVRDTTAIFVGDTDGSRTSVTGIATDVSAFFGGTTGGIYVDSPATTSATTYKVQITGISGFTVTSYVNRSGNDGNAATIPRGISYIRVYEVD